MSRSDVTARFSDRRATLPAPQDFGPTASLGVLRLRSEMLDWMRGFFREHGYWEVETPVLSYDVCVDAWLEPFQVPCDQTNGIQGQAMYLQTSPEFGMKRLLAAGADAIFQITRAFRQEECGRLHNPEFTIVEWYRVGDTYDQQMDFVEELAVGFEAALQAALAVAPGVSPASGAASNSLSLPSLSRPVQRLTYGEALVRSLGEPVHAAPASRLEQLARQLAIVPPASLADDDREGWLNLLFLEAVEPMLANLQAAFIFDYPASQAALSRVRHDDPPVAERFELYVRGLEICNGYQELTDPDELRERFAMQSRKRRGAGRAPLPIESRLLAAMEAGLPPCAGVALGFDRLLMAMLGAASIEEVVAFPMHRA